MALKFLEWRTNKLIAQIRIELAKRIKERGGSSYAQLNNRIVETVATIMAHLEDDDFVTEMRENTNTEPGLHTGRMIHLWDWCTNYLIISRRPEVRGSANAERDFFERESRIVLFLLERLVNYIMIIRET